MRKNDILVIISSPRKNSNSTFAALKLAENINKEYNVIDINKFFLKPCTGCFKCTRKLKCNIRDDFDEIMIHIKNAKVIIVASPIYFTGVPGQLKIFIDRNQQQWEKYKRGYYKKLKKVGYIILTSGSNNKKYFKPAESEIKSFFVVNGIRCKKIFRFGNMDIPGKMKERKYIKELKIF
ncbi:MAG: flavodoxin family protein [Candidatus Goldbacteria bacterium]|nr:flavodoxin family protein [Candidatus Goldiibacteriota bacterium]